MNTKTHWNNPWDTAIPVSLEELAACHIGLGQICYSASGNFTLTVKSLLDSWKSIGDKLDPYIVEDHAGFYCMGIRYGNEGHEYLSPAGSKDKIAALFLKYR